MREHAERIARRSTDTPPGNRLPLRDLGRAFNLSFEETAVVVICLAAELYEAYGRAYSYLHDDVSRHRPSPGLVLDLLADDAKHRVELRRILCPDAPLFADRLLSHEPRNASLDGCLSLNGPVLQALLERFSRAPEAAPRYGASLLEALILPSDARDALRAAVVAWRAQRPLLVLRGARSSGRATAARAVAEALRIAPALLRLRSSSAASDAGAVASRWLREVRVAGALPILDVSGVESAQRDLALQAVVDTLRASASGGAVVLTDTDLPRSLLPSGRVTEIVVPGTSASLRGEAWRAFLGQRGLAAQPAALSALSSTFPFTVGQIERASRDASVRMQRAAPGEAEVPLDVLRASCHAQADHRLTRLAQRVSPVHGFDDIVLPPEQTAQLREIVSAVQRQERVLERWGFGEKASVSPGISVLFSGPSGTGKTMAAGIVAATLGMELYRVDLARVVSKYIGETEKNLETVFEEARRAHAVLLFDEADALLGKRSDVSDAHDRYANIEVAYLLQRMEGYEGVAILATNLRGNIDTAFLRRLRFAIEFPHPNEAQRLRIWRGVWPRSCELSDDIDLGFLARSFDLSGGHIRNIALTAAYLAAEDGVAIGMRHLVQGVRREFQKLGRVSVEAEFGEFRHLLARARD